MKRKAFTLIELLAVIVILAIIALIATPIILGVIENAKKGAFKDAAYGIINATEIYYAKNVENGIENNLTFNITDGKVETLTYKGSIDGSGKVILTTEGKTILCVNSSNNKYNASKSIASSEVIVKDGTCSIDVNNMILYSSSGSTSSDYYTKEEVDNFINNINDKLEIINTKLESSEWIKINDYVQYKISNKIVTLNIACGAKWFGNSWETIAELPENIRPTSNLSSVVATGTGNSGIITVLYTGVVSVYAPSRDYIAITITYLI